MMKCYCCNKEFEESELTQIDDNTYCCKSCIRNYHNICDYCDHFHHVDSSYEVDGYYYCHDCFELIMDNGFIEEHDYKPEVVFYGDEDRENNLHIGIELEINPSYHADDKDDDYRNRNNFIHSIKNEDEIFYFKEDASLNDTGIEIVSMPMTYQYMIDNKVWASVFNQMKKFKYENVGGCGLHFHLDKEYLNKNAIRNIDYLVNTFSEFFAKIGGRIFNTYCVGMNKALNEWGNCFMFKYNCVHDCIETLEIRFCASTSEYKTFLKRLKMIVILVELAKSISWEECQNMKVEKLEEIFKKVI